MRDFKGMKRQRGRNRGGNGGSSGKPQQHNANRAFDSNGPEGVKVRGAAQSVFEKYQQLARDASTAGDRVLAENYLQHAEHYFRLIRAVTPNRPVSDIVGRDQFSSGFDIDFEAEPEEVDPNAEAEAQAENDSNNTNNNGGEDRQQRFDRQQRDDRGDRQQRDDRGDRPRFDRQQRDDRGDRQQRDDRPRDDRPREDRAQRDDRPQREDRARSDDQQQVQPQQREGGRRDRWRERGERNDRGERSDPMAVIEPQAAPLVAEAPAPEKTSPRLRGQDGAESDAPALPGPCDQDHRLDDPSGSGSRRRACGRDADRRKQ